MDEIYEKYARFVYRYLLSLGTGEDVAEELTQETFYQAYRSLNRMTGLAGCRHGLRHRQDVVRGVVREHPPTVDLDDSMIANAQADPSTRCGCSRPSGS